jgi:hypothetical protein
MSLVLLPRTQSRTPKALPGAVSDTGHEQVTFGELMKGDEDGSD